MALRLIPKRLVGQTVRGIRNRMGQTQEQFAESIGAADGDVIASWEEGRSQPDTATLAKIAAMGLVDVLVFQDDTPADEIPQLTPGEASELRGILSRMEALLDEAREIVDRASDRTVVEMLESAAGSRAPAPGSLEADGALTLAAEVTVKPRARAGSSGGSGGGSRGRSGGGSGAKSSGGGSRSSSTRASSKSGGLGSSSSGSSSSGSSSSKSRGRSGGGSGASGGGQSS